MTGHVPRFPNQPRQLVYAIPEGDTRVRAVCEDCGYINYANPKVVVGTVCSWEDRILLCRRAIEPRRGFWTIPAGYLEEHETTIDGALRETREEAGVSPAIVGLMAVYSVRRISQVQLIYKARLPSPTTAPGPETLEARLFAWADIPWSELAFPSVHWALNHFREVGDTDVIVPRTNPAEDWGDIKPAGL
ncbi:MAG: NUDIX domain-containing protein [Alphaproteobacteria bacterium]|nr:NUDIX domain-containing protein [Alphaproteobacteria bacterium]